MRLKQLVIIDDCCTAVALMQVRLACLARWALRCHASRWHRRLVNSPAREKFSSQPRRMNFLRKLLKSYRRRWADTERKISCMYGILKVISEIEFPAELGVFTLKLGKI